MGEAAGSSVEEKAFEFSPGLYGFPDVKRYVVTDIPGGGDIFKLMLALDQPDLGFTLVYPFAFFPDYAPDIPESDAHDLGADKPEEILVMCIANVPEKFKESTANLKAPLAFNPHTRKARQIILPDDRYTTRHSLFPA
ncbi:MAG TPA: flagellar assembly protein FliW [Symbiobacteriaceae bacterium]|nr:flagellar assembly protein FliW [Symbiobacteriaceae bacterium]